MALESFDRAELYDMLTVAMSHGTWTDEQLLALIEKEPHLFAFFPRQTPVLCLAAVKRLGYNIAHVKEPTPELCLAAVTHCGDALADVPRQFRTPELELAAVTNDGWVIDCVTKQTPEMCLAAVRNWPVALAAIKMECRTFEVCLAALPRHPELMKEVPPELRVAVQTAVEALPPPAHTAVKAQVVQ